MLFNSFAFALFFPIVLIIYWRLPLRGQNIFLLLASYFFYGYWDWRFLSLIAISTVVDFISGLRIEQAGSGTDQSTLKRRKFWLILSICTNLGILGFFKYFNFFIGTLDGTLSGLGVDSSGLFLNIILPVGISFYTFQTMSYTIDIYRGKMNPTRKFLDFALYVSFFPQLVAGPIERAVNLLPRIMKKRSFSWSQLQEGGHLILQGLFKKVFVADNLAPFIDRIFANPDPSGFEVMVGGWAFAFQVYGDFSGYSDIARGCAKCMGIDLMINFNHPYVAASPAERWQRWHISLTTWLRDYLYIPLGGSRKGKRRTYINLGLTMTLGGLWHGAAWNFVLWGAWEGMLLMVHRWLGPVFEHFSLLKKLFPSIVRRIFNILLLFELISIGLVIFRGQSMSHIGEMLLRIATLRGTIDTSLLLPLLYFVLPLTLYEAIQYIVSRDRWDKIAKIPVLIRTIVYAALFYLIAFHGAAAQSFIYFQF